MGKLSESLNGQGFIDFLTNHLEDALDDLDARRYVRGLCTYRDRLFKQKFFKGMERLWRTNSLVFNKKKVFIK